MRGACGAGFGWWNASDKLLAIFDVQIARGIVRRFLQLPPKQAGMEFSRVRRIGRVQVGPAERAVHPLIAFGRTIHCNINCPVWRTPCDYWSLRSVYAAAPASRQLEHGIDLVRPDGHVGRNPSENLF